MSGVCHFLQKKNPIICRFINFHQWWIFICLVFPPELVDLGKIFNLVLWCSLSTYIVRCAKLSIMPCVSLDQTSIRYPNTPGSSLCLDTFSLCWLYAFKIWFNIDTKACDIFYEKKNPIIMYIPILSMLYFH